MPRFAADSEQAGGFGLGRVSVPEDDEGSSWWTVVPLGVFWFLFAALHLVIDPQGFDVSLLPRLLALLVVLVPCVAAVAFRINAVTADRGPPVAAAACFSGGISRWLVVFTVVTWLSLAWAFNPVAGLADAFKVTAVLAVFGLTCLLLPHLPRWRDHLPVIAACGALALALVGAIGIWAGREALPAGTKLPDRAFMESHVTGGQSNVNLYANLLVLLLPWCLYGAVATPAAGGLTRHGWRRLVCRTAAAAVLVMVALAQSRAAWLGLAAGLATALAATLVAGQRLGLSRGRLRGISAAALTTCACVAGFVTLAPDDVGIARRLRSIVVEPPAEPGVAFRDGGRREIWRLTARMIADRPFLGVGAGNFGITVQSYFDESVNLSRMHHNWSTPHNDFLWVFAEKGIVGFISFVGFLLASAVSAARLLGRADDRRDVWIAVWMLALLAAYTVISCLDFPLERVSQPVVLGVSCGVLAVLSAARRAPGRNRGGTSERPVAAWLAPTGAVLAVVLAVGAVWTAAAVLQDRRIVEAYRALRGQRWEEMLERARQAASPWRTIDSNLIPLAYHEGYALMRLGRSAEALASVERSLDHNPNRLSTLSNLGILYVQAGRFGEAEICLREVVRRYPQHPPGYVNLANCLVDAGRPAEAVALLEAIPEDMRPREISAALKTARAAIAEKNPE